MKDRPSIDPDWLYLMKEAKELGLSIQKVKTFLQHASMKKLQQRMLPLQSAD